MPTYLSRLMDYNSWANRGLHGIRVHGDDWPPDWGPEPVQRARGGEG